MSNGLQKQVWLSDSNADQAPLAEGLSHRTTSRGSPHGPGDTSPGPQIKYWLVEQTSMNIRARCGVYRAGSLFYGCTGFPWIEELFRKRKKYCTHFSSLASARPSRVFENFLIAATLRHKTEGTCKLLNMCKHSPVRNPRQRLQCSRSKVNIHCGCIWVGFTQMAWCLLGLEEHLWISNPFKSEWEHKTVTETLCDMCICTVLPHFSLWNGLNTSLFILQPSFNTEKNLSHK